jgi:hypothetical protein
MAVREGEMTRGGPFSCAKCHAVIDDGPALFCASCRAI